MLAIGMVVIGLVEILIWLPLVWRWRKVTASVVAAGLVIDNLWLVVLYPKAWLLLISFFSAYRVVNLLRVVKGRTQSDYLFREARRGSLILIGCQLLIVVIAEFSNVLQLSSLKLLYFFAAGQLVAGLVVRLSSRRHLRTTMPPPVVISLADRDLPTITVAIPARNETDNLEACLHSLLTSDYPKLEILVLDDCSQEKRTPEIIRNFARSGVRFVAGKVPPEHWLAKNYAYQQLVDEASGDMLLFCGVDIRFEPDSLRVLSEVALFKKKSMLSIIPVNVKSSSKNWTTLLTQPSRYAWELALPRRWFRRPGILSSCWLISKELLKSSGSFEAVANSISPESYFARKAMAQSDGYSFIQSDNRIGIQSDKPSNEQLATAVRTRYPQLHRRPEITALVTLAEIFSLIGPFVMSVVGYELRVWPLMCVSLISSVLQLITYGQIADLTYRSFQFWGYLILPLAALYDLVLLNYSMWRYEFREVIWKDRNVCIPVMRLNE